MLLATRNICIIFSFLTFFGCSHGRSKWSETGWRDKNDFDYLVFTQQWPETACFHWKLELPSHNCLLPRHEEWTIHGIWPSQNHKMGPFFCNKTEKFEEKVLIPIENQLDEKWINIRTETPHFAFWKHEWEKHGTCAMVLSDVNSELKYFSKGLDLLKEYEMSNVLAKANIVPGRQYAIEEILAGVKKILGKSPNILCIKSPKTQASYIMEIRICLDKTFKLRDCDEMSSTVDCDPRLPVNYPSGVPTNYNVIQI